MERSVPKGCRELGVPVSGVEGALCQFDRGGEPYPVTVVTDKNGATRDPGAPRATATEAELQGKSDLPSGSFSPSLPYHSCGDRTGFGGVRAPPGPPVRVAGSDEDDLQSDLQGTS